LILLLLASNVFAGANPRATVIQHLPRAISVREPLVIDNLVVSLPATQDSLNVPSESHVKEYRNILIDAFFSRKMFELHDTLDHIAYRVKSTLIEYEKGNAFKRVTSLTPSKHQGECRIRIEIIVDTTGEQLFIGEFTAEAKALIESTYGMFTTTSINFVSALRNDLRKHKAQLNRRY
jgi:hypothetical protein